MISEPKIARTFDTFTVETNASMDKVRHNRGRVFYQAIFWPLKSILGLKNPSINAKGVVRYTVERTHRVCQLEVHERVNTILTEAVKAGVLK